MRLKDDESGQVLILTALCLVALMGFLALAVDVGILFNTKRQMQTAADAAATAAALEYLHNGYNQSAAITAGTNAAAANNVSDGNTLVTTVRVNANPNSPTTHKGCSGSTCFFEAIVSKQNPTIFYRTFFALWKNGGGSALTVSARAVAGTPGVSTNCISLTAPTGTAFQANGAYQINASGCSLYVNSNSSSAMTGKGASGRVNVSSVSAVGQTSGYSANFPSGTALVGGVIPQSIPFSNIVPPTPSGCVAPSGGKLTGTASPGCYSGNVTIGSVTLAAGTYIFTGNVTINGAVTGHNVALDINSGSLTVKPGNSAIDLTAPTSGTFNGVSIYQPLSNTNTISMQAGSATGAFDGFIVAPGATLSMQDHGGSVTIGGLVVSSIDNGPAVLNIAGYDATTSPLKFVSLVE